MRRNKVVWFDNLVASVWISSLGENYENKTCCLCNDSLPSPRKSALKFIKKRIKCFRKCRIYTAQLESWKLMGLNMKCLNIVFLQIMIFQSFTFKLSVFKYFGIILRTVEDIKLTSICLNVCI